MDFLKNADPDIWQAIQHEIRRQQDGLEHTQVIAFTAWPEHTAHQMAMAYGCDGVITKPIDTRAFAGQVSAYLHETSA